MRLTHYINENASELNTDDMDEVIAIIKDKCQPFLNEFNMSYNPIYRGSNKKIYPKHMVKVRSRTKRHPKDMPLHLHKLLDTIFFEQHGWKARSEGVFVTHDQHTASNYGWGALFFPTGKYQYLWNPNIPDLYRSIREEIIEKIPGLYGVSTRDLKESDINQSFIKGLEKIAKGYTDKGFNNEPGASEGMFKTHEYYMVSFDSQKQDNEFLFNLNL